MSRLPARSAPVVRLTIDRVVVRGAGPVSRAALTAAIEAAVAARVAANPDLLSGAAHGSALATLRQDAQTGSSGGIADALAIAVTRGLGGGA